ncbi:hypothetical protein [Novosphingobium arvoryzae]|uniref:hypothetical protein n=1 Tax=Novosphingobium arvoryzae TaxID=1256514 RepID=UPI0035B1E781
MMRLKWFSPLPPARTDIANYSARVLAALAERADVEPVEPANAIKADPRDLNRADLCIYHIGNNPDFHGEILSTAIRHPGVIVLHDHAIHELCFGMAERGGGPDAYEALLHRWHGRAGLAAAQAVLRGALSIAEAARSYPLFEAALDRALAAVTHNPAVADELSAVFPLLPVLCLPLPYHRPAERPAPPPAKTVDEPIRLVMFGFMNANRRAMEVIEAWGASPFRDRFTLDLAGELGDRPRVVATAERAGLADRVTIHGFVPEGDLDALIRSADLVLNLRNPSMGEASGSQLRIWANARAAAVTRSGWYAALPDTCVRLIGEESEHDDLLTLLADLAQDRIDLAALGSAGFDALAAHDPAHYAAALVRWLEDVRPVMLDQWARTALIEAAACSHATSLPARLIPEFPACLTPLP